jgi:hypothetical protein
MMKSIGTRQNALKGKLGRPSPQQTKLGAGLVGQNVAKGKLGAGLVGQNVAKGKLAPPPPRAKLGRPSPQQTIRPAPKQKKATAFKGMGAARRPRMK